MSTLKHENMFKLTQNSIFQKYLCAYAILKHCAIHQFHQHFTSSAQIPKPQKRLSS